MIGDEDIKKYQKISLRFFITSGLLLMFTGLLSAGDFYIQLGIKNKLLSYFEINILLVCILVITGIVSLGIVIKEKPIKVVLNILIVIGLVLYLLYSFIVRVDTDYTEFYSESGEERFLAIESHSGSELYQVRGGIFIHRIGELKVGDHWFPIKKGTFPVHWDEPNKIVIVEHGGNRVELYYK